MEAIKRICFILVLFSASVMAEEKAFHPTDALLIGGNGGFNPSSEEAESPIKLPGEDGYTTGDAN